MQKGDIVLLEFTGRDFETGKSFETTVEKTAKNDGIHNPHAFYQPTPVIIGKGRMIQGVEDELLKLKVGEEKKIVLDPSKAFGERRQDLIGIVPLAEFTKRKVQPFPGLVIDINGSPGRIQSVSGGRVRVDFNNDLAGKTVEYELKVVKKIEAVDEKAKALVSKLLGLKEEDLKVSVKEGELEIELPEKIEKTKEIQFLKEFLKKELSESIPEAKKISFKEFKVLDNGKSEGKEGKEKAGKAHVHDENCRHEH